MNTLRQLAIKGLKHLDVLVVMHTEPDYFVITGTDAIQHKFKSLDEQELEY